MLSKLYSYYFTNLLRKNWIRLTFFSLLALVGAWFLAPFASYHLLKKSEQFVFARDNFRDLVKDSLNSGEARDFWKEIYEKQQVAREAWEAARKGEDEAALKKAEKEFMEYSKSILILSSPLSFVPPIQELEYNELSLGVETKIPEHELWRVINKLSFWALATGVSFTFLTLHLVDFLFLAPKKNGEEATVLNFTPGVKRSDLLISKILVFLTYYSLFGLVVFILPGFFYYLWVGSLAPLNLVWLFLYTLLAAPLLAFGLVLLPFILISNWNSFLGSLFSYAIAAIPAAFFFLGLNSPWAYKIRDWFFNPLIFVPLALGVGVVCLALYYYQCQSEDLKN